MTLNDDQKDWVRHLGTLTPTERCYCGWDYIDKCYHCKKIPGASLEQRLKLQCPNCHNYPSLGYTKVTHNIKCVSQDWQPVA